MERGYVKMWRKSLYNDWLKNPELWVVWSYCLMKASYKKRTSKIGFQEININPGQFIFGRKKASEELNMSEGKIRRCIESLRKSGNITIKTTNKFSIITIVNWHIYQSENIENDQQNDQQTTNKRPTNDQQTTNKRPTNDQQTTTDKNIKNIKNDKNNNNRKKITTNPPDIFPITDQMKNYAKSKNYISSLEDLTEAFLIHHRAKGNKFSCWYSAWQRWLRNQLEWHPEKNIPQGPDKVIQAGDMSIYDN